MVFGQLGDDTLAGGTGDDYVEGNGGNDSIRGGLGQDDLVGGSSDHASASTTPGQRADGRDEIFGGDGSKTGRDEAGDLTTGGHANDADTILGDNGNISKVVNATTGAFVTYNYDNYAGTAGQPAWSNCSTTPRAWPARPTSAASTASTARTATMASGA